MNETHRWLSATRFGFAARAVTSGALLTVGLALAALGLGVVLGRLGLYGRLPPGVLLGWALAVAVMSFGVGWCRAALRRVSPGALAREIESAADLRSGSIGGLALPMPGSVSASLTDLADRRAVEWLQHHGRGALARPARRAKQSLGVGGSTFAAGLLLLALAGPRSAGGNSFWHPLATLMGPRGPVLLDVDRREVRRGDSVTVSVEARGRSRATLWLRSPGEQWSSTSVSLDSAGRASAVLGPLDSDRFLRATSGDRESETIRVVVRLPALITDLQLVASFPSYLERDAEPVVAGPEPVLLPVGTELSSRGRATVPLLMAEWRDGDRVAPLTVDGASFSGAFRVHRNGAWQLHVMVSDSGGLEEPPPELHVVALSDSVPVVAIPVPIVDTAIAPTLRQPVVIDARDDYALTRVEMVSWRVSGLGTIGDTVIENVPLTGNRVDRAVLQWSLDLNERGFIPGDTARFKVRAVDNAPRPQVGESRVYSLWLPSMSELRRAVADRSDALAEGSDSLLEMQRELTRQLEDLAAERQRDAGTGPDLGDRQGDLPFEAVERAQQLSEQQEAAIQRADALRRELRELSDAAWSAGITDPEFHRQLRDLQELLEMALSDELEQRLSELRDALEQLDPERVREALQQLANAADQLRSQLERGRELFERAAIEGELSASAAEADDLARRQGEWNETVAEAASDSAMAARESELSERADSLSSRLERLGERVREAGTGPEDLQSSSDRAGQAAEQMSSAAHEAGRGRRASARQSGQAASDILEPLASDLERQRDDLRNEWRAEVLEAMDRALVETARLAEQQQEVVRRLGRGESDPDVRAAQAAARSGVDKVRERLEAAAGKNALVSPQTGAALGFARLRMSEALEQLQRATPNTRRAGELAGEAVDGLNAVAYQLLRSRADVAGAESGSGLSEALERLADLAEQQGDINSEATGMLSLLPTAGEQLVQELAALAEQQRALGNELDRLQAEGDVSGAGELAEEAREIARELAAARLDPQTIERQEQLFRRLLNAGRTLRSEEEDQREERVSETADQRNVRLPPSGGPPPSEAPRFRYPTWDELRSLSPAERRLVLDYFRRLNDVRP